MAGAACPPLCLVSQCTITGADKLPLPPYIYRVSLTFTKMHGAGNDFVCLDAFADPALAGRDDLDKLAAAMCDRRSGIGADGLVVISAPEPDADLPAGGSVRMRMFNADGTESAMCGNGLRCVAKYVVDHGRVTPGDDGLVLVQTGAGVMRATCRWGVDAADGVVSVVVDMGRPVIDLEAVGVRRNELAGGDGPIFEIEAGGSRFEAVFVSMGNPHAVIHVEDVQRIDLAAIGPTIERHRAFPQRMNAHFVEVIDSNEVVMRTWERGSGLTGACGSGACAVCVAGVLAGRTGRSLLAHLPGGDLQLEWSTSTDHVLMTGPAVEVFSGRWPAACGLQTAR